MGLHRPTTLRKVAILIEASRSYSRDLIHGIGLYNDEFRNWQIDYRPHESITSIPRWIRDWKGDGILARINDRKLLRLILETGIPAVDLRRSFFSDRIPQIGPDDRIAVEMVYGHFRRRGFDRFGFVGMPDQEHLAMDLRRRHFRQLVERDGFFFSELMISLNEFEGKTNKGNRILTRWLKRRPERTAILACNDDFGLQVLNTCRISGLPVPGLFAVAGIGNDDCICMLTTPKLTSVDLNPTRIGYESAKMLQQMMDDPGEIPFSMLIRPNRIVSRMSTSMIATDDKVVSEMVQLIRREACGGLTVRDVLRKSGISRSGLENRFKEHLGHSVFQEILAVRLERVQELLIATDMTIKEISAQSGFNYQGFLMRTFQKRFGQTMKSFRRAYQTRDTVKYTDQQDSR